MIVLFHTLTRIGLFGYSSISSHIFDLPLGFCDSFESVISGRSSYYGTFVRIGMLPPCNMLYIHQCLMKVILYFFYVKNYGGAVGNWFQIANKSEGLSPQIS